MTKAAGIYAPDGSMYVTQVDGAGNVVPAVTQGVVSVKRQPFLVSGTYTPAAGMLYCIIECVGGGGGGAGCAASPVGTSGGGGGGSGGYSRTIATAAQIGASKTVTIAGAGVGGAAGANNGTAGGDTSVGTLCVAKGGSPGTQLGTTLLGQGGLGGIAGTGDLTATGNPGLCSNGATIATINGIGGLGGNSIFGGAPIQTVTSGSGTSGSSAGNNTGAGGNGGSCNGSASTAAGGNGGTGIVFITEFCSQ